jgi:hypothetical protein
LSEVRQTRDALTVPERQWFGGFAAFVIARHGDRSPYAKHKYESKVWCCHDAAVNGLSGVAYQIHGDRDMSAFWTAKLPSVELKASLNAMFPCKGSSSGRSAQPETMYQQLTALGADQMLSVGSQLRQRYVTDVKLLPSDIHESLLYVRSTNASRTVRFACSPFGTSA